MKTSSARLSGLGTTIFAEMSARALRTGAVNLGQGFPDTDGPAEVIEIAVVRGDTAARSSSIGSLKPGARNVTGRRTAPAIWITAT